MHGQKFSYKSCALSEVTSYRASIRTAKGVVQDIGVQAAARSGGLSQLAAIPVKNSERDGQKLCKRLKLALPVEMSHVPKAPGTRYVGNMYMLKLESWINFILSLNNWHILCGLHRPDPPRERAILSRFWDNFRKYEPGHAVWEMVERGVLDLSRTAPLLIHGDEGRGRKRNPFLVLTWHCVLGLGTDLANKTVKKKSYTRLKLNYSGSSHLHRFHCGVLPKMTHNSAALEDLLQLMATSALKLMNEGINAPNGEKFFAVTLYCTGDWAWIVKAGQLARGFGNVIKRLINSRSQLKGIGHLCQAGQRDVHWEGYKCYRSGEVPSWHHTLYKQSPFNSSPALSRIPFVQGREAGFYAYDLFHAFHLGIAKSYVPGCLALASDTMPGGAIDERFEHLTAVYMDYCDRHHLSPYLNGLSKDTLGWPDRSTMPNGQWNKGHVSTALLDFYVAWSSERFADPSHVNRDGDDLLRIALEGGQCIQRCLHELYAGDVFLPQNVANAAARDGLSFLECYRQLATRSFRSGRALFPHMPKGHAVEHIFWQMFESSQTSEQCLSPLVTAVQVSEDYVGKCSRLARRVSPMTCVQRVLERTLQAAHKHWSKAGWIRD